MGSKVNELEKQLAAKEKEKEAAGKVLSGTWTARGEAGKEVARAKEALHRLKASTDIEAATFLFRQQWKHASERIALAERKDAEAAEAVRVAQEKYDAANDECLRLREELAGPRLEALREKVASHLKTMRENHEAALAEFRQLVELHADAVAAAPERVVSKRAINRYLLVRPKDPAMREAIGKSIEIRGVEPGAMHLEYFRAMSQSGPDGRFELLPGQDLVPPDENDRDQVEIIKAPGRLPEEITAIEQIDLGIEVSGNGAQPPPAARRRSVQPPPKRLNFHALVEQLRQERLAAAAERKG